MKMQKYLKTEILARFMTPEELSKLMKEYEQAKQVNIAIKVVNSKGLLQKILGK